MYLNLYVILEYLIAYWFVIRGCAKYNYITE